VLWTLPIVWGMPNIFYVSGVSAAAFIFRFTCYATSSHFPVFVGVRPPFTTLSNNWWRRHMQTDACKCVS
jgi:hypothetical protein